MANTIIIRKLINDVEKPDKEFKKQLKEDSKIEWEKSCEVFHLSQRDYYLADLEWLRNGIEIIRNGNKYYYMKFSNNDDIDL